MELDTERLLLREYVPGDWRAVLAYMAKPGYDDYYEAQTRDEAYARDFIGWLVRWQGETPRRRWQLAVTLKGAPDVVIGSCGLRLGAIEEHIDSVTPVAENEGSAAVPRRLGFSIEGRLRENDWQRGAWHDTVVYGLLRSEWAQQP